MVGIMTELNIKKKTDVKDGMNYIKPSIKKNNTQKPKGLNMKLVVYVAIIIALISSIARAAVDC